MQPAKRRTKKKPNVLFNVAVIVAILGCVGSIGAALFGTEPFAGWLVTVLSQFTSPTPQIALPTNQATEELTLFSDESVEETPTPVAILIPGNDWLQSCISKEVWMPYLDGFPLTSPPDCYELNSWGINAENGKLTFVSNTSQTTAVEYGIFTPWQNWSGINFSVQTKDLENSEFWLGVFEGDTINSKGIVFVIQPGDDIDIRELPRENYPVDNVYLPYAGGKFNVNITLSGGKIKFLVDGQGIISDWPVDFTIKNMFIGYRSLPNTLIDTTVYNLNLVK